MRTSRHFIIDLKTGDLASSTTGLPAARAFDAPVAASREQISRIAAIAAICLTVGLFLLLTGIARADDTESETDRLRDALRAALQQQQALEDQRTTLQAQLTDMTRDRDRLSSKVDVAYARIKTLQKDYDTAVTDFNKRLEERNQILEKWKSAYEDAADVARAKDAERAKFQGEAEAYQAANKVCRAKNAQLVKVSSDILAGYRDINMWKVLAIREPMIGFVGVDHENRVQAYLDRILDQKVQP
jgi:uncharacterized phage infection (PIP) family protein YhgE